MPQGTGKTVQVPVWAGATVSTPAEGSAFTASDTNTTDVTISLATHGVYHQVTDLLASSSANNVFAQLGEASGRSLAEKMDTLCWAQFANFTGGTVAASGTELEIKHILQAAAQLKENKVGGQYYAVIHPGAAYNLKKQIGQLGGVATYPGIAGSNLQNRVLDGYFIGTAGGVEIYESALVTTASGDDLATQGVFASSALGMAVRGDVEMETQRDATKAATDVVMKMTMGVGVLQPTHGVKLLTEFDISN